MPSRVIIRPAYRDMTCRLGSLLSFVNLRPASECNPLAPYMVAHSVRVFNDRLHACCGLTHETSACTAATVPRYEIHKMFGMV